MKYKDDALMARTDFKTIPMPFAMYCSLSSCQTLIKPGEIVKRYDGATYVHHNCPRSGNIRNFAPHKQPKSYITTMRENRG